MQKYLAEFIGTFSLVLFGCGTAAIAGTGHPLGAGLVGISLAFGLTLAVMVYALGGISGCHINPAVTLAMAMAGKIKIADAAVYIGVQVAGATAAAFVLWIILQGNPQFIMGEWALGSNGWGPGYLDGYTVTAAFVTETVLTFLFVLVIFAVTSKTGDKTMAGLAIGLCLVVIHLLGISVTGVSVNPARSFGPAIFAGGKAGDQLWLFWVAPLTGACLAALVWKKCFDR
jgi:aquaporin Z